MKVIEVVLDDRLLFFFRQLVIALLQQLGHDIIFLLPFGLCSKTTAPASKSSFCHLDTIDRMLPYYRDFPCMR